jgi:hypothetical protein
MFREWMNSRAHAIYGRLTESLTERRQLHGIRVSVLDNSSKYDVKEIWARLVDALDLIAVHRPIWIGRMHRLEVGIHVRVTPGTRAKLLSGKLAVLDSYFVSSFPPAQTAASIIHEATHARIRATGVPFERTTLAKEERLCRQAELRFGRALLERSVPGAEEVVRRAEACLSMTDDDIAPNVDWQELAAMAQINRLRELPLPEWMRRWVARRSGLINTAAGGEAFGRGRRRR